MSEYVDDVERQEQDRADREAERKSKKEPTTEDLLKCPTWDCDGGPEVWPTGVYVTGGELWCVGCPKCKGWMSQFLVPDDGSVEPYTAGIDIWMSWRKDLGH